MNFNWNSSLNAVVKIKNNEIFGASAGTATVTVSNSDGTIRRLTVKVVDKGLTLALPQFSFGTIKNSAEGLVLSFEYFGVCLGIGQ